MTECEKIQELISAMHDGELTENEKALVLDHIKDCAQCRRMHEMFTLISEDFADTLSEPPVDFKNKVMAQIRGSKKRGLITVLRPYTTVAACFVIIAGLLISANDGFRMGSAAPDMSEPRAVNESALADVEDFSINAGTKYDDAAPAAPEAPMAPMGESAAPAETNPSPVISAYCGIVTDMAMSVLSEAPLSESRAYITVACDDGIELMFWIAKDYEVGENITIGSRVIVESIIEEETGLLTALNIELE